MTNKSESAGPSRAAEGKDEAANRKLIERARQVADDLAEEGEAQQEVQQQYDEMWSDRKRNQRSARTAKGG